MKWLFRNELGRVRHAPFEYHIARIGMALVAIDSMWRMIQANNETTLRDPHGIASIGVSPDGDLGWLGELVLWFSATEGVPAVWFAIFVAFAVWYVVGWAPLISSFVLLVIHTLAGTFYMSQGAMHHTQQVVTGCLIGQLLATAWVTIKDREPIFWPNSQRHRDTSMFFIQQMIAAGYVITGLTKLEKSDGAWITDAPNLVVQFEKNKWMDVYNELQPSDDRMNLLMIDFLTGWPLLGMLMFSGVLILEFAAFLALFNRSILALWGLGLIAMHIGISAVMQLNFIYNEWLVFIFFVNAPYWISAAARQCYGCCGTFKNSPA